MPAEVEQIRPLQELRRARAHVENALMYTAQLEDRVPEETRDTIGHHLLSVKGELDHLIGDVSDGA